jgi:hypothetical protein
LETEPDKLERVSFRVQSDHRAGAITAVAKRLRQGKPAEPTAAMVAVDETLAKAGISDEQFREIMADVDASFAIYGPGNRTEQ